MSRPRHDRQVRVLTTRLAGAAGIGWMLAALPGCAGSSQGPMEYQGATSRTSPSSGDRPSVSPSTPRGSSTDLRPALAVSNTAVPWERVWEPLAEYGGGVVVSEVVLDTLLEKEIARLGLSVTPADVEAERAALTRTVAEGVGVPDAQAQQLVQQVTRARALGPRRMPALLRRNAMLRAIARTTVAPTEDAIQRAYQIQHGRRYITRLITTDTQRDAAALRDQILAGDPASIRARFAEAAVASSTDPSGSAGGLLGPISPSDTTLPAAVRASLESTPVGALSPVLALESGFAIVLVEGTIEPDGVPMESVRPRLETAVRDRMERLQMDVIAREMLAGAQVTVFDRSLNWGWENTRAR